MEYLKLLGVLVVIIGFALKLDNILIIVVAAIVTALVGGIGVVPLLEIVGNTFASNRSMLLFIVVMVATGTLERNGMRLAAAKLISKIKGATPSAVVNAYGVMRAFFAAFNVGLGGVAGFVRPVIIPMAEGSIESHGLVFHEEHLEKTKARAAAFDNIGNFFAQLLVVGGSGGLLVFNTLKDLGYQVALVDLVLYEIPVSVIAIVSTVIYFRILDRRDMKKYYGIEKGGK